jgi:hypothetical protein
MSKISSECKPYAMSDEEWARKQSGGGKVATFTVLGDDGYEVTTIIRGIAKGRKIPDYKKANACNIAEREIGHNKLIGRLREKLVRKKIAEEIKAAGGAGGGGK